MRIGIASDHRGYQMKTRLAQLVEGLGHDVIDYGPHSTDSVDYPDFAAQVASGGGWVVAQLFAGFPYSFLCGFADAAAIIKNAGNGGNGTACLAGNIFNIRWFYTHLTIPVTCLSVDEYDLIKYFKFYMITS